MKIIASGLLSFVSLTTQDPAAKAPELPAVTAAAERMVADLRLRGAALAILHQGKIVHRSEHAGLRGDEVIPIASASKWLAVATVLSVVDTGELALDAPVHRYLPGFDRDDKRAITLRHCMSCMAGLPPRDAMGARGPATMAECAAAIAELPLIAAPGERFQYGGATYQVAACAAERVTGKTFHELFAERIAKPLGMQATKFGRLIPVGGEAGTAAVPWVAGGAVSNLDEYSRFVAMLQQGGSFGGATVLKPASVQAMLTVQSGAAAVGLPGLDVPEGFTMRYGLATWLLERDGAVQRAMDPGAFGFTPWLDLDGACGGVFAVRDRARRVVPALQDVQRVAREALGAPVAVPGTDTTIELEHGGRTRSYVLHLPPPAAKAGDAGLPLVLVLHGGGGNAEQVSDSTGFSALADREGFVVAYPNGTGRLRRLLTWNSGGIPVYAVEQNVDDVGFLKAVVADVRQRARIDAGRVFATGMSNGAMMCHRLAREAGDLFAAVAPVSGAMNFTAVEPKQRVAVMMVHGTADEHVLYDGGKPKKAVGDAGERVDASVQQARDHYLAHNGLHPEAVVDTDDNVRIETWAKTSDGKVSPAPLRIVTLTGGGHAWPGGKQGAYRGADEPFDWPATAGIWRFFAALPPRGR